MYKKKPQPSTLILFNNIILVLKPKSNKKGKKNKPFQLDFHVNIDQTVLTDLGDTQDNLIVNAFEIKNRQNGVGITLCAISIEEKRTWLKLIKEKIKDYQIMTATRMRNKSRSNLNSPSSRISSSSRNVPSSPPSASSTNWGQRPSGVGSPSSDSVLSGHVRISQSDPNLAKKQDEFLSNSNCWIPERGTTQNDGSSSFPKSLHRHTTSIQRILICRSDLGVCSWSTGNSSRLDL